jgi:hypothetical protein
VGTGIGRAIDAVGTSSRCWILAATASTLHTSLTPGSGTIDTANAVGTSSRRPANAVGNGVAVVLSFLLNSMSKDVLGQVVTETSATGVWHAILGMFASQSRARIVHLRSKLSSTRKGEATCTAYYYQI